MVLTATLPERNKDFDARGRATQGFCKDCGTELNGARFCPECGAATENARPDAERSRIDGPETEARRSSGRRWLIAACAGAAVAAVLVALLIIRLGSTSATSYATQARRVLTPVIADNRQLGGELGSLTPRSNPGAAQVSVKTTIAAANSAQHTLAALNRGADDQPLATDAHAALTSELAWLNAAAAVLAHPDSPMLSQLGGLGANAQAKLQTVDAQVPGASSSFPASTPLITYAQGKTSAAGTRSALSQFSSQVQAMLTQSGPAFQQINQVFGQMQTAASGGTPTITLAQATATITSVISNRTALAASARTLNAPTPLAASVRAALVTSMEASLTNDQDISNCLNQANNGTVAIIFQGCLSSTEPDSNAATIAKQHFLTVYNQLRGQIGQPTVSTQF